MEPIDMLKADPLDILFENRNKLYGAYPLRKFYAQRLYFSMGITLLAVILFSVFYLYFHSSPIIKIVGPLSDYNLEQVDLVQPSKPVSPPARLLMPKPPVATVPNTTPLIVPPDKPIQPMATISELDHSAIGVKTLAGVQDGGESNGNGNSKSDGVITATGPIESKPEVFRAAEVMPEFPGGIEALKRYLNRNLRMPESSLEPGSIVHVVARFVVGADGRVSNIEIIQAADAVFNIEVKRVISKMPVWKPGSQNQRNVAVYFDLPVNFVSSE
jgi:periplasmic protein TonB